MRTFRDAKAMARSLRAALAHREIALSYSECLEIVAAQFGVENWNTLVAKVDQSATRARHQREDARPDSPNFETPTPIVRILSVDKAKEFYVGFLGFTWDWEHRYKPDLPLYAQISRSELKLHLSEHHTDGIPGSTVLVLMNGIDDFKRELAVTRYTYSRPRIEESPWNARVLEVTDPFGNRLRFSEARAVIRRIT
jgi:Glyoxalase superfamily protein